MPLPRHLQDFLTGTSSILSTDLLISESSDSLQIRSAATVSRERPFTFTPRRNANLHPNFRAKSVCDLSCKYCCLKICKRGMKAILLADTRVELFSTDYAPIGRVQLVDADYTTTNCNCRIRDVACLGWFDCFNMLVEIQLGTMLFSLVTSA